MKKIFSLIVCLLILFFFGKVYAVNDFSLNGDVNFQLYTIDGGPLLTTIVGKNGGQATFINVENNYIDITLDNASTLTFNTSTTNQYFKITKQSGSNDYTLSPTCITNTVTMTGTGATVVLRLEVTTIKPSCAGSGGGGGGGSIIPTNFSVSINNGAECTASSTVNLTLTASNASQFIISNTNNFNESSWQNFINPKVITWSLTAGDGLKTVYVKFRSPTGNESSVVTDLINLNSAGCEPIIETEPMPLEDQTPTCVMDCTKVTHELYIVNPNGTIRTINSGFVKETNLSNNKKLYHVEDSGSDMDFNDLEIETDNSVCGEINVKLRKLDAGWHHQIWIKLFYNDVEKENVLLWMDSHTAFGDLKKVNLNEFSNLCEDETIVKAKPGELIKGSQSAVYYLDASGKRHAFPNQNIYKSWYKDFSRVKTISDAELATYELGENVVYRPGVRMVKFLSINKVYVVDVGGVLRWVESEDLAKQMYGDNWNKMIDDVSDAFWTNYTIGQPVLNSSEFNPIGVALYAKNISFNQKFDSIITENIPLNMESLIFGNGKPVEVTPIPEQTQSSVTKCKVVEKFVYDLQIGDVSEEVRRLQTVLKCLGYFPTGTNATAIFGPVTEDAVKKFQTAKGIPVTGIVGPLTRNALNNL